MGLGGIPQIEVRGITERFQNHHQAMWLQNFRTAPQRIDHVTVLYIQGEPPVKIAGNHRCPLGIDTLGNFYRSFTAIQKYFSKLRISCRESISRVASL